jgi:CRISPR/Cas system-associated endonuclease Cas1
MKKEIKDELEVQEFVASLLKEYKYIVDVQEMKDNNGYLVQWQEHKSYISHDGKEFRDEIWLTEAGELFQVQDLTEAHCRNILRMFLRNDREARASLDTLTDHLVDTYQAGGLMIDDPEIQPTIH